MTGIQVTTGGDSVVTGCEIKTHFNFTKYLNETQSKVEIFGVLTAVLLRVRVF
jgi:hypothetical protein